MPGSFSHCCSWCPSLPMPWRWRGRVKCSRTQRRSQEPTEGSREAGLYLGVITGHATAHPVYLWWAVRGPLDPGLLACLRCAVALWGSSRRGRRQLTHRGAARQPHAGARLIAPCSGRAAPCQSPERKSPASEPLAAAASRGVTALAASQLAQSPRTVDEPPRRRLLGPLARLPERASCVPQHVHQGG